MTHNTNPPVSRRDLIKIAALSGAAIGTVGASSSSASSSGEPFMSSAPSFRLSDPEGLPPSIGFSQVAEVTPGKLIYVSGQVPRNAAGDLVGPGDFRAQLEQVFANLGTALRGAGASFADVVKLNYYCVASIEPAQQRAVVEVRDRYVNTSNPPASTFVFVSRLVNPAWLIEIEAVAVASSNKDQPVVVLAQIEVEPASMAALTALARKMAAETLKEDGCLHYAFAVDVAAANRLQLSEWWRDDAALSAHLQGAALREFRTELRKLKVRSSTVRRYDVSGTSDLAMPPLQ